MDTTANVEDGSSSVPKLSSKKRRMLLDVEGSRMKGYEDEHNPRLDPSKPFLVRLDGHGFSKFTSGMIKPFDSRLSAVMAATMLDLVEKYHPRTGYTHSDEITLVFHPANVDEGQTLMFSGKVMKISSLLAGFASARFNAHITSMDWSDRSETFRAKMSANMAHFDARSFSVPDSAEAWANLMWRSNYDCRRNSVNMLARAHYSTKALNGVSTKESIRRLEEEKGVFWSQQPAFFKHGVVAKKEQFMLDAVDRATGKNVKALRSRLRLRSFEMSEASEAMADLVLNKYWPDDFDPEMEFCTTVSDIADDAYCLVEDPSM